MPKKIILIRHGETDYNKERRIQGWLDIPLNTTGHQQGLEIAQKLANHQVHALYSSDLSRAQQTAQYLAKALKLKIKLSTHLRERDMGLFAGWSWERERDPVKDPLWQEFEQARDQQIRSWAKHGGESIGTMMDRVSEFLSTLHHLHTDQTVVLVTHGGTINRIFEHFELQSSTVGYRMHGNTSVNILIKSAQGYQLEATKDL